MDEDKKPTGKRFRRMENISSVFSSSDLNHRLFGHEGFQFFLFQKRWKLVGQVMAKESYVSSYKNDMLFVTVTNSVFLLKEPRLSRTISFRACRRMNWKAIHRYPLHRRSAKEEIPDLHDLRSHQSRDRKGAAHV